MADPEAGLVRYSQRMRAIILTCMWLILMFCNIVVLSWKERRTLEAREKESTDAAGDDSFEIADAGDFEELEKRFDLSSATMTDLSSLEVFSEPEELQESVRQQLAAEQQSEQAAAKGKRRQKGPRTFVVPSMLFGSHKSEGHMIPSRTAPVKVKFSHKRVFGDKKLSRDAASE